MLLISSGRPITRDLRLHTEILRWKPASAKLLTDIPVKIEVMLVLPLNTTQSVSIKNKSDSF